MKVLVTDGCGLLGSAVVRELVRPVPDDLHLADHVSMAGPWAQFERVNGQGTRTVLAAVRAAGVDWFVLVSSPSVARVGGPWVGAPAQPADPADAPGNCVRSKAMSAALALGADRPGFASTAVRPHLVWGWPRAAGRPDRAAGPSGPPGVAYEPRGRVPS
ncbi:MAG: NAD-dependent epimerase/dehydratase family protein [Candidatus Nanopelagicales bacterium]